MNDKSIKPAQNMKFELVFKYQLKYITYLTVQ